MTYTATDNNGGVSPAATATIVVAPVNDAPTLTGLGPTLNYVEANSATVTRTLIDTNVVLGDIDAVAEIIAALDESTQRLATLLVEQAMAAARKM